ncbi:nucleoplasmin-like protein ANO39 isoform X2 [Physella acuta]|uniref:nucleoplasmin-like protein ANO39 isoform X2 n=1 Tax=Physella acuta TaxID=109671 RepID=UPI0027DE6662|nr:nucleoplasmin-like protein ANO39 isoform X2 [Physella acuta]
MDSSMSKRTRTPSDKSNKAVACDAEMEYFWSMELNASNKTYTWMVSNQDLDDDDEDFIEHTVFLKLACLGATAVPKEQNVVMLESLGGDGEVKKGVIVNLTRGESNMTQLDLTIAGKVGATFTLVEGSGPVFISGNHLLEYPKDEDLFDQSQTESEVSEEEGEEEEEEENVEEENGKKSSKRKASVTKPTKQKKPKMDVDDEDDDEEEEDEVEEDDDDEDDEDYEETVMVKKGRKGKDNGAKKAEKVKAKPVKEVKEVKKVVKKSKK